MPSNENGTALIAFLQLWTLKPSLALVLVEITLLVTSLLLNSAVLVVISFNRVLHTTANIFIASLAASDIIFSTVILPFLVGDIVRTINGDSSDAVDVTTTISLFFLSFSILASYIYILMVTLERWLYIAHPFVHEKLLTPPMILVLSILPWLTTILANVDVFILTGDDKYQGFKIRLGSIFPCLHFAWLFLLGSMYFHIAIISRHHIRAIQIQTSQIATLVNGSIRRENTLENVKATWKYVRLLVVVFGAFFLLQTPIMIACLYVHLPSHDMTDMSVDFFHALKMLSFIHYCNNFLAYASQHTAFREKMKQMFRGSCCQNSSENQIQPQTTLTSRATKRDDSSI